MKISKTAVIVLFVLFAICILPPLYVISSILYSILRLVPFVPWLLSYWRGIVIILFLSTDITFWTISGGGKSLFPWSSKKMQISFMLYLFIYILMNMVRFIIFKLKN
jgi:hypothetical protein